MRKINLKPCPFCGSETMCVEQIDNYILFCKKCTCSMELPSKSELINRWNTRHYEMTIKKTLLLIVNIAVYSFSLSCLLAIAYQVCLFFQ